ncbi:hypothetical protein AYO20_03182 [Fonsecaea nubica]|uniref:Uncharacterized protein n=1 Tax=Fonsecaea nubica TaxID=856822 RepID=A0A178D989_9EURO|nr:hypothetical protein AYO20_03182 [Fonsecaea nubica]OAL37675.1 hypothetical protein AYO20_03182 [Fonsecaea nubica]
MKTHLLILLCLASKAFSWGELGHRTVGYLAQMYFTSEAENLFDELVHPTESFDISDGAVWADDWATQTRMPWSKPWHYIDAKDNPPKKCKVNFNADCDPDKKCIVTAIANMVSELPIPYIDIILKNYGVYADAPWPMGTGCQKTKQVNNPRLKPGDQSNALKFLLHFLGDITQPLHTEQKCRGGTKLMVQWGAADSRKEDLHQVWDKLIIQKLRGYKKPRDADPDNEYDKQLSAKWAADLKKRLDVGRGGVDVSDECTDITTAQECALAWASEANAFICTYVLKDVGINLGPDPCETCCNWEWRGPDDLSDVYYKGAVPIVEEQVAKAGWRLGQWINALAEQRVLMKSAGVEFARGDDEGGDEALKVQMQPDQPKVEM